MAVFALALGTLALPGHALAAEIAVTNQLDEVTSGNGCSLREAINAANDDVPGPGGDCTSGSGTDTILIPASTSPYPVSLGPTGTDETNALNDLDVSSNMTIAGAGAASTVIESDGGDRVFDILGDTTTVEIRDVTITGGHSQDGAPGAVGPNQAAGSGLPSTGGIGTSGHDGGGIRNDGTLTLTRVTVRGNVSGDGGDGGAGGQGGSSAAAAGGGSTGGQGLTSGSGGGIYNDGTLTIADSTITQNSVGEGGDGGAGGPGGTGGTAVNGFFGGTSGGGQAGFGGAGGGIFSNDGDVTITGSEISENSAGDSGAGGAGGPAGTGGAGTTGGGQAGNSGGGLGAPGGFGGGISSESTVVAITDSTIRENQAGDGSPGGAGGTGGVGGAGGTVGAFGGASLGGNGGNGGSNGAVDAFGGTLTLTRVTVSGNRAGDGGVGGNAASGGAGGAGGTVNGGGGSSFGGFAGSGGDTGGVAKSGGLGVATLRTVTISGNLAGPGGSGGAGGAGPDDSTGGGGGNGGNAAAVQDSGDSMVIEHATIASNVVGAAGAGGGPGTGSTPAAGAAGAPGTIGGIRLGINGGTTAVNSIIAANSDPQCGALVGAQGSIVFPDNSCNGGTQVDPLLSPLADNGGPTFTRLFAAGSPARDGVPTDTAANCPATDQRGVTRPKGAACDIGAVELSPPAATTGEATGVTATGAALGGTVNPGELATSYRFEFGKTEAYGSQTDPVDAGGGAADVAAAAILTGLEPSTTYHYRLVATNTDGSATGVDRTFTTLAGPGGPGGSEFAGVTILSRKARATRRGRVPIRLSCPADAQGSCTGTLTLTAKTKRKRGRRAKTFRLGRASFSIEPGRSKKVNVKLSRKGKRQLRSRKRLRSTATAVARDNRGVNKTTTRRVTVRAAKKRRRR